MKGAGTGETDGVVLAMNMGDFATTAGITQKTTILST